MHLDHNIYFNAEKLSSITHSKYSDYRKPDDTHLVAGMSSGFLSIKYRLKQDLQEQTPTPRKLTAGTYRYFVRGKNFKPQEVGLPENLFIILSHLCLFFCSI